MHLIAKQFGKSFSHSHAQQLIKQEDYLKTGRFGLSCNSFQFGSNVAKKKILRLNPFEAKTQMRQTPFLCHACWSQKRSCGFRESALPVPTGGEFTKKTDGFLVTKTWPTTGAFSGRPSLAGKIAIFAPQDQQLQHQKFCQKHPRRGPGSTVCSLLPGSQGSFSKTFKDTVCFSSLAFCLDFISLLASKTLPLAQQWAPIRLLEMTRSICFGFMEDPWPGFSLLGSQTS